MQRAVDLDKYTHVCSCSSRLSSAFVLGIALAGVGLPPALITLKDARSTPGTCVICSKMPLASALTIQ